MAPADPAITNEKGWQTYASLLVKTLLGFSDARLDTTTIAGDYA